MEDLLDTEELDIVSSLDKQDIFKKPSKDEIEKYKQSALYTKALHAKKQTTIRFNISDLVAIKAKAKELGIGYQNLIQALVHNYATGKIKLEL